MGARWNRLVEAVLTSTHNLCFEQKCEKYQNFLPENFPFWVVKFSIYLNRRVFVMMMEAEFSAYDCTSLHCIKPFIVNLPSSLYDFNSVDRDVKKKKQKKKTKKKTSSSLWQIQRMTNF